MQKKNISLLMSSIFIIGLLSSCQRDFVSGKYTYSPANLNQVFMFEFFPDSTVHYYEDTTAESYFPGKITFINKRKIVVKKARFIRPSHSVYQPYDKTNCISFADKDSSTVQVNFINLEDTIIKNNKYDISASIYDYDKKICYNSFTKRNTDTLRFKLDAKCKQYRLVLNNGQIWYDMSQSLNDCYNYRITVYYRARNKAPIVRCRFLNEVDTYTFIRKKNRLILKCRDWFILRNGGWKEIFKRNNYYLQ